LEASSEEAPAAPPFCVFRERQSPRRSPAPAPPQRRHDARRHHNRVCDLPSSAGGLPVRETPSCGRDEVCPSTPESGACRHSPADSQHESAPGSLPLPPWFQAFVFFSRLRHHSRKLSLGSGSTSRALVQPPSIPGSFVMTPLCTNGF